MVYNWLNTLRNSLFPPGCRLCLAPLDRDPAVCRGCREELPWLVHACRRCALPLPAGSHAGLCGHCLSYPPELDGCRALFAYRPPVDQWIQALKFGRDLGAARLLGELLAGQPDATDGRGTATLLPVPLHPARLRQRGYNQALEIARPLLRLGWRPSHCDCRRSRHTGAQSGLPAGRRRDNIRGAFRVGSRLEGESIVLIDDVMTTGATLNELARALKDAGAARVEARVIARTLQVSGQGTESRQAVQQGRTGV